MNALEKDRIRAAISKALLVRSINRQVPLYLTAINGRRFCKAMVTEEALLSSAFGPYWMLGVMAYEVAHKLNAEEPNRTRWIFARTTYEDDFIRGYGQPGFDPVCDALMADVPR